MPARSERPLVRICTRIYAEDYDAIREICALTRVNNLNLVIREAIRSYVAQTKARERLKLDKLNRRIAP